MVKLYVGYCEVCDLGRVSRREEPVTAWGVMHVKTFIPRNGGKPHQVSVNVVEAEIEKPVVTASGLARSTYGPYLHR